MTRATILLIGSAFVAAALMTAPADPVRALFGGAALAAEPTASTTIPDDTYGEGGTKQSFSNDKQEVMAEVWRDARGIVREQFEIGTGGEQLWGFFNGDGSGPPSAWRRTLIAVRAMDRPAGRWQMWVIGPDDTTIKEMSTLSKAELDTEFGYWHAQLRIWVNTARRRQQEGTG